MIHIFCNKKRHGRRIYRAASCWLLLFILFSASVKAQFTNGNFSAGTFGCPPGGGWTTGSPNAERTAALQPNRPGDYWIDLTPCGGWGNGAWIEQAVPVVVGNCYYIEFEIAAHCGWDGSDGGVNITLDGQPLGGRIYNDTFNCTSSPGGTQLEWKVRTSPLFTAVNNPTVIRFTGDGRFSDLSVAWNGSPKGAPGNPGVIALDNIVLVSAGISTGSLSLGNDTTFCGSFSHVLDASPGMTSYQWSTGDVGQTVTITNPGTYWCTVTSPCATASDTIRISQASLPQVHLGADITACEGDTVVLTHTGGGFVNPVYQWSTGATTPTIRVTGTGAYVLTVEDQGCSASDTIAVTTLPFPVINLGNDTSLCVTALPLTLRSPQPPGSHYLWSNGLSDTTLEVTKSGRYWLQVSLGNCVSSDTIFVDAVPDPLVYIGADTIICEQFPHRIGTEIAGSTYRWNTGETTPYIHVRSTGSYSLEVNLDGCMVADTVQITAMPVPDPGLDSARDICPEQTIILDATYETNSNYLWSTGETTAAIAVTSPGRYSVQVTSVYHCIGTDTILLNPYPLPSVFLQEDTTVCEETPLLLSPLQLNADSLVWSDGTVGNVLSVRYGGTYVVTAVNKCGNNADTIVVKQIFCDIWLPNAFTPNGDGVNDVFRVLGNVGRLTDFGLGIYNRWGERIFFTQDKYSGWDGIHRNLPSLLGTYVYMLEYSIEGKPYLQKGNFHLLR